MDALRQKETVDKGEKNRRQAWLRELPSAATISGAGQSNPLAGRGVAWSVVHNANNQRGIFQVLKKSRVVPGRFQKNIPETLLKSLL